LEKIDRLGQAAELPGAKGPQVDPVCERLKDRLRTAEDITICPPCAAKQIRAGAARLAKAA
jgi:hypothetical protein